MKTDRTTTIVVSRRFLKNICNSILSFNVWCHRYDAIEIYTCYMSNYHFKLSYRMASKPCKALQYQTILSAKSISVFPPKFNIAFYIFYSVNHYSIWRLHLIKTLFPGSRYWQLQKKKKKTRNGDAGTEIREQEEPVGKLWCKIKENKTWNLVGRSISLEFFSVPLWVVPSTYVLIRRSWLFWSGCSFQVLCFVFFHL